MYQGFIGTEMCIALYEPSLGGMTPVDLPITERTNYKGMVHDDYHETFGHAPHEI